MHITFIKGQGPWLYWILNVLFHVVHLLILPFTDRLQDEGSCNTLPFLGLKNPVVTL